MSGAPVVLVAGEIDVVAYAILCQLERTGADPALIGAAGCIERVGIADIEQLEEIEDARPRAVHCQHDRVLIGGVDIGKPLALFVELIGVDCRIANANQIPFHVFAGELAAAVELHAFAQLELEPGLVVREIPRFGEHGLRLASCVVCDEPVPDAEDGLEWLWTDCVWVDQADVADQTRTQDATGLWLGRGGGGGGLWREGGRGAVGCGGGRGAPGGGGRRGPGARRGGRGARGGGGGGGGAPATPPPPPPA